MVLGMSLATFTLLHVLISIAGLGTGFVELFGLLSGKRLNGWTAAFLTTTVATSLTGFLFPVNHLMPSHVVGIISLTVLAVAIWARYSRKLPDGHWRIYAICACVALYLNFFVGVVQSFEKVSALKALAPTQSEPPFVVTQLAVLLTFIALGYLAARKSPRVAIRAA